MIENYIAVFSDETSPLIPIDEFRPLQSSLSELRDSLGLVLRVLSYLEPERSADTIFVEIGHIQTLDDLEDAISELKRLFDL
ncbi:hypothetical protein, partial [Methylobacterium crusticola]|uniref:hypothetical protein n=1 Tax=Methylobacterium crusticola TaxID=1697972 RepID=UPI001EE159CF